MPKRKLVSEVASGSDGKVKINETFLNNLVGDTEDDDEFDGKLELGPTSIDITNGLKIVTKKTGEKPTTKYTVMLYISRSVMNTAVQFLEIESELPQNEIIEIFFKHLKCELPGDEKIKRGKKTSRRHFGKDEDFNFLVLSKGHAYVYINKSDGKKYRNDLTDAMNFIYRNDPENRPSLCSIM